MRVLLTVCVILLASFMATAGQNPSIRLYLSFDPVEYVPSIEPAPYSMFSVYVCMDCLGDGVSDGGVSQLYFRVDWDESISPIGSYTSLVPMGLPITWPDLNGNVPISLTECVQTDPCPLVRIDLFWVGGSGCILLNDHTEWPRYIVDCNDEVDYYCVGGHGSVAGGACPSGDPGCDCSTTPVENSNWGRVKALYRQ